MICADFDPVRIAREYEKAGAAAISVLTDESFSRGASSFSSRFAPTVKLPLLRKDFIIEELQVYEAAARGADAILLIVAILDDVQLKSFACAGESIGIWRRWSRFTTNANWIGRWRQARTSSASTTATCAIFRSAWRQRRNWRQPSRTEWEPASVLRRPAHRR